MRIGRYVDDLFIIWSHSINTLLTFFELLNNQHSDIKFIMEIETNSFPSALSYDFLVYLMIVSVSYCTGNIHVRINIITRSHIIT